MVLSVNYTDTILDPADKIILRELLSDSRKSIRRISRKIGIPSSTIYDRIKKLEKNRVIRKYTIVLDEKKLGYTVKALILINVDGKKIREVEEEIARNPNVQVVLDITGEFDIAVIAVFRSIEELDKFVKSLLKMPAIRQTRTSIAFRTIKQEFNPPLD